MRWFSPILGKKGWVAVVLLVIAVWTLQATNGSPWWLNFFLWLFIWFVPMELLRMDAIEREREEERRRFNRIGQQNRGWEP